MDDPLSKLEKRLKEYQTVKTHTPIEAEWLLDYRGNYARLVGPEESELIDLIKLVLDKYTIFH